MAFDCYSDIPAGHARLILHEVQQLKTNSSTINETPNTKNSYSSDEGSQGAIPISCQDIYNCASDAKAAQELLNSFSCSSPLEKNLLSVKEEIKEKEESLLEFKQEVDRAAETKRRLELYLDMGKLTCSNCHQKKSHKKISAASHNVLLSNCVEI